MTGSITGRTNDYIRFNTTLSPGQVKKLQRARKDGRPITITIKNSSGPHELYLTETQLNKINKAAAFGRGGARIKFSETQMKNQVGGFLGAIVPFLTKTILPALGTLGLSAASGAISGATNKATRGSGLYRTGDTTGDGLALGSGLYRTGDTTGDGLLPVLMDKKTVDKILNAVDSLEKLGVIEKGSLDQSMKEMESQHGGFIGTLLATLAGSLLPALLGNK